MEIKPSPSNSFDRGDCGWRTCNVRGTARRKDPTRGAGRLTESPTRKPESELAEKLSKVENAFQNAVIKKIMADFGLEGVTKKRLGRYHREQRELRSADDPGTC